MRNYRNNLKYKSNQGFTDLLFNLVVGFVFLFMIAFLLINPISKKEVIDPKAEFMIIMTWPDADPSDIDMWVKRDEEKPISFRSKDSGLMHLDRDDMGSSTDTVTVNGKEVILNLNREAVSIRQKINAKFKVSAHWFSRRGENSLPTMPVHFELIKINPYTVMAISDVVLESVGAEQLAFSFETTEWGEVRNISKEQEIWIQEAAGQYGGGDPYNSPRGDSSGPDSQDEEGGP